MGRKKIEIRPLVEERNRNVTFLKRKAGLMKKAWELSVLCGADVSIIIFSAAGKAYEFSSLELDSEIDRYMDYEGMIERRRAPEFAAMAAAGEDEEDEDEDDQPRRGSVSKAKGAGAGAGEGAVPRSLKGKETYKARTPRPSVSASASHGQNGESSKGKRKGKGKAKKHKKQPSEKKSFVSAILSESEDDSSEGDGEESDTASNSPIPKPIRHDGRREKRVKREKSRSQDQQNHGHNPHDSEMLSSIHYALNMYNGPTHSLPPSSSERSRIPREAHQDSIRRHTQHEHEHDQSHENNLNTGIQSVLPAMVPPLPRLPSDAITYFPTRTSHSQVAESVSASTPYRSSAPSNISVPQLPSQSQPIHQSYGYASGSGQSGSGGPSYQHYGQAFPNTTSSSSEQYPIPYPYPQSQQYQAQPAHSQTYESSYLPQASPLTHGPQGFQQTQPIDPGAIQWDQNLIARYAEFQLQQNHQRQQRLLLERQRQQLANLGVPVDERSLLDDLFGNFASAVAGGNGAAAAANDSGSRDGRGTPNLMDISANVSSGEFVWPLNEGSSHSGGTASGTGVQGENQMEWNYDGVQGQGDRHRDRDRSASTTINAIGFTPIATNNSTGSGTGNGIGGIPSPVSNSAGSGEGSIPLSISKSRHGEGELQTSEIRA